MTNEQIMPSREEIAQVLEPFARAYIAAEMSGFGGDIGDSLQMMERAAGCWSSYKKAAELYSRLSRPAGDPTTDSSEIIHGGIRGTIEHAVAVRAHDPEQKP